MTDGWSVVGTEPIPIARAASIRFCTAGMTQFAGPLCSAQREHDAGHVGHRVGKSGRRVIVGWEVFPALVPLVTTLRPPCLAVERAELPLGLAIGHHEKPRDLLVTAVRCLDRRLEHEVNVLERIGSGLNRRIARWEKIASPNGIDSALWSMVVRL